MCPSGSRESKQGDEGGGRGRQIEREPTSELDCSDSTMSWDTLAGADLANGRPPQVSPCFLSNFEASSTRELRPGTFSTYPFHTCVGAEPTCLDELAPILCVRLGVRCRADGTQRVRRNVHLYMYVGARHAGGGKGTSIQNRVSEPIKLARLRELLG